MEWLSKSGRNNQGDYVKYNGLIEVDTLAEQGAQLSREQSQFLTTRGNK